MYGLEQNVVNSIINLGKMHGVEKIVLFGSRARGDYKERSDIDIAVYALKNEMFFVDIHENVPTLLKIDVIDMRKNVQEELKSAIEREGVTLYEKI